MFDDNTLRSQYPAIREHMIRAYNERLEKSRPYWEEDPRFPFLYNGEISHPDLSIAYDVSLIPKRQVGCFEQIVYEPPLEANQLCKPREALKAGFETLAHELKHQLLCDPLDPNLVVVPNRYPRAPYHCLLLSQTWRAQRLAPEFVQAELEWATRGFVLMFHRRGLLLNHFHLHLFLPETVPVTRFAASFQAHYTHAGLAIGSLAAYPVPHIALAAEDSSVLYCAIQLLVNQFDAEQRWFNQVVLRDHQKGRVIALFFLWPDIWIDFYFDPTGLIRSKNTALTEEQAREQVQLAHMKGEALDAIRNLYWQAWKTVRGLDSAEIAHQAVNRLQRIDARWSHADHQELSDEELGQIFILYTKSYASGQWMRFQADPQDAAIPSSTLSSFRRFYHHAFLLRDAAGQLIAFALGKDTPFGIKLCLGGTKGTPGANAVFLRSLFPLIEGPGIYGQASGKIREVVLRRCDDRLSARMAGQQTPDLPIVNPRLASYVLGSETTMDPDGTHCHWQYYVFSEKRQQSTRVLVMGNPLLDPRTLGVESTYVHASDTFLMAQRREKIMEQWAAHELTTEKAYHHLTNLLANECLFTSAPDHEPDRPQQIDEILAAWQQHLLKLWLLSDLYRLCHSHLSLPYPSAQTVRHTVRASFDCEERWRDLPDMVVREVACASRDARDTLARLSRIVLTEQFCSRHPLVAEGRAAFKQALFSHIQHSRGGVIGIGGSGGVGKSTLSRYLADCLRQEGREILIVPTDALLRTRQDFHALLRAVNQGHSEDILWDIPAYHDFLSKVAEFRQSNQSAICITIAGYYDHITKERSPRDLHLTKNTILIVEGWTIVDAPSQRYFDVTVMLDVREDQVILNNLLRRLPGRDPARAAYLKERFVALDRPYAAHLARSGRHYHYDYLLDNTDFECPLLYSLCRSQDSAGGIGIVI